MKLTIESLPMYCTESGHCLLWNLSVNGAGKPQARLEGRHWLVQRYVYFVLMDNHKTPGAGRITTRCGHATCVSPKCLMQSSYSGILKRSYKQGKRAVASEYLGRVRKLQETGRTKLDWDKAAEIRASDKTSRELSEQYGVNVGTINRIRQGIYWRAGGVSAFTWRP